MKKDKLLLIRYGAFGDWIYTVPILPKLFEKYEVILECSGKVGLLSYNDPRYKHIECFQWEKAIPQDVITKSRLDVVKACDPIFKERTKHLISTYKPDKILNLNGSIETYCIPESFQTEFNWSILDRRKKYAQKSFYDAIFARAGLQVPKDPKLDCLYYSDKEQTWGKTWRQKYKDQFIIMLAIAGSTYPKIFHNYREYIDAILKKYPDALIIITGDDKIKKLVPKHPRIKDACFNAPMKQIFLMAKYADYVIGPETGVLCAAGMWGTPKTMMCTMSSIEQCTKYQKNDYSVQAPIYCSPCLRAIYTESDCYEATKNPKTGNVFAPCSKQFKVEMLVNVLEQVRKDYEGGKIGPHLPSKYSLILSKKVG